MVVLLQLQVSKIEGLCVGEIVAAQLRVALAVQGAVEVGVAVDVQDRVRMQLGLLVPEVVERRVVLQVTVEEVLIVMVELCVKDEVTAQDRVQLPVKDVVAVDVQVCDVDDVGLHVGLLEGEHVRVDVTVGV